MRISDWSSDVCSSDLRWMDWQLTTLVSGMVPLFQSLVRTPKEQQQPEQIARHRDVSAAAVQIVDARLADRKSVVSGKSVSVRVDLGGRRIIKKKKRTKTSKQKQQNTKNEITKN